MLVSRMPDEVGIVAPGASRSTSETPRAAARRAAAVAACGEVLRRRVLHLDRNMLVLDKPAGLPVQGGPGNPAAATAHTAASLVSARSMELRERHEI